MKEWLLFSKIFQNRSPAEVARITKALGFHGVDLLVRDGYTVPTRDIERNLSAAVEEIDKAGLSVPLVTTDINSADDPLLRPLLATCRRLGIRLMRLGWWRYDKTRDHAEQWQEAQRQIHAVALVAAEYGVFPLLQMHGSALHQSPTRTRLLIDPIPESLIGIYFDPGNMVKQEGYENWHLSLAMLKGRLHMVGVKNGIWQKVQDRPARWQPVWVGLDEGFVPWDEVFRLLHAAGYAGPLSFHSHYEHMSFSEAMDRTAADLAYAKEVLAALDGGGAAHGG